MITVSGVTKRYGETTVVDNVSLTIRRGGITALIGPNGAGKSTLLGLISRLQPLDAGQVLIDGLDVATTPSPTLARRLAILRQENTVTSRLTVFDLVAFGRYPHSRGRLTAADQTHIADALRFLNLEPLAHRFLDELSGGQRQRAFVAMVLCQDTDYLLLDEPLNSLDLPHAVTMMRFLRRAARELGKTVVVVLHDINCASCYADEIIALRDGRVVAQGPPAEIMTSPVLAAIYDLPVRVETIAGQRIGLFYP